MKYYAVRNGREPGIYRDAKVANRQTIRFSNAEMKVFTNLDDAEKYLKQYNVSRNKVSGIFYLIKYQNQEYVFNAIQKAMEFILGHDGCHVKRFFDFNDILSVIERKGIILYTDGSYIEDYLCYGGAFVAVNENDVIVHQEAFIGQKLTFIKSRNYSGEALAFVNALKWAVENDYEELMLITDSDRIKEWLAADFANCEVGQYLLKNFHDIVKPPINFNIQVVKSHHGNFYNNFVDQLAREEIKNHQTYHYLQSQFTQHPEFICDFLNRKHALFVAACGNDFEIYESIIINATNVYWIPSEKAVILYGKKINKYGTYMCVIYGDEENHFCQRIAKCHSKNIFVSEQE